LPDQLAVGFRGALSFRTAGELANRFLTTRASAAAATALLGFAMREDRARLLALLER
jgi:hypothetical protein